MLRTHAWASRAGVVTLVLLAWGAAWSPAIAAVPATATPTYAAVVSPTTAPGGTTSAVVVTLTQLVEIGVERSEINTLELGSAQVTPPAGFAVVSASARAGAAAIPAAVSANRVTVNFIELHHPGQTATITMKVAIGCGLSGGSWGVVVHQTDRFTAYGARVLPQSPASVLGTQVSACSLAFVAGHQPAETQAGANITSVVGNPAGAPVQVRVVDGSGAPLSRAGVPIALAIAPGTGTAGAILSGTTTVATDSTGLASFGTISINQAGLGYALAASSAGFGSALSAPFDVQDVVTVCSGTCTGTVTDGNTTGTVTSGAGPNSVLTLSLAIEGLDCNDAANHFYVSTSEVLSFALIGGIGNKSVTITLDHASVTRPAATYQVCFSSPITSFINRFGVPIPAGGSGLLPDCGHPDNDEMHHAPYSDDDDDAAAPPPCVVKRTTDAFGNVSVRFLTPQGDPRGRI